MYLYPRLLHSEADDRAHEVASLSLEAARARSDVQDPRTVYSPTGGTRVPESHLRMLRSAVRDIAARNGYPTALNRARQQRFDAETAVALKNQMGISASEATRIGVWAFIACVVLPEVVRWRFPGGSDGTTLERFTGGNRGLRNTFGRLWWRAHLLGRNGGDFSLLDELGEDELVQITERPVLAGNPYVAQTFAQAFVSYAGALEDLSRSDLMRDAIKRLRRLMAFVSLDVLGADQLSGMVEEALRGAASGLGATSGQLDAISLSAQRGDQSSTSGSRSRNQESSGADSAPSRLSKLVARLHALHLEVIDKRPAGGCLWVVDREGVADLMRRLQEHGYPFKLATNGSRSTDGRRAWYLSSEFPDNRPRPTDPDASSSGSLASEPTGSNASEDLDAWERGEVDTSGIKPDYGVVVRQGQVQIKPKETDLAPLSWGISDTTADLQSRLRFLATNGSGGGSLAVVAATMAYQKEFLQRGIAHLRGLTLSDIAEYLGVHESTVSRSKDGVFLETPRGVLPLAFFFSEGLSDGCGPGLSARSVRVRLKELLESEPTTDPWTDEEISFKLTELGIDIARRTVAKYRGILGIPNALERRRDSIDA